MEQQSPDPQGRAPQPPQNGPNQSASDLLAQAMQNLMMVGDMMTMTNVVPPEEVHQYAQLVAGLQKFIQTNLGGSPQGQKQPEQPQPASGPAPTQSGGNMNARPSQF